MIQLCRHQRRTMRTNNRRRYLGNLRLTEEHFNCPSEIKATVQRLESQGKTVILLNDGKQVLGLFAVADTVKNSSREAIEQLHELGVKTIMLTGDNPHTAKAIASQVGIDEARGNQLPEDKHRAVEEHSRIGITGMVGDGINLGIIVGEIIGEGILVGVVGREMVGWGIHVGIVGQKMI